MWVLFIELLLKHQNSEAHIENLKHEATLYFEVLYSEAFILKCLTVISSSLSEVLNSEAFNCIYD